MQSKLASIEFTNQWECSDASHSERVYVPSVNFWRAYFPIGLDKGWEDLAVGESLSQQFKAGELVVPWSEKKIYQAYDSQIITERENGEKIVFAPGRYFSNGLLPRLGFPPDDRGLFRVISHDDRKLIFDFNAPLAKYPLKLTGKIARLARDRNERGGQGQDIMQTMTSNGLGMQARLDQVETAFYADNPFQRENEADDCLFYESTRLVKHVDSIASDHISEIYSRFLNPGIKVLDLMSGSSSHLPEDMPSLEITGLGLNQAELDKNTALHHRVVHNLNQNPILPFENQQFDLVICSLSVEYLNQPQAVFKDIARILKPEAQLIITFSDRWLTQKVTRIWKMLYPFERMGLVTDFFKSTGRFENLATESIQGYYRPYSDPLYKERRDSDPIFAVWGQVKA
jgi:SAM-dependent methyltransferase